MILLEKGIWSLATTLTTLPSQEKMLGITKKIGLPVGKLTDATLVGPYLSLSSTKPLEKECLQRDSRVSLEASYCFHGAWILIPPPSKRLSPVCNLSSIGWWVITGLGGGSIFSCSAMNLTTCVSIDAIVFCSLINRLASASLALVVNKVTAVGLTLEPIFGFSAFPAWLRIEPGEQAVQYYSISVSTSR